MAEIDRGGTGRCTAIGVGADRHACLPAATRVDAAVRVARMPLGGGAVTWTGIGQDHDAVLEAMASIGLHPGAELG